MVFSSYVRHFLPMPKLPLFQILVNKGFQCMQIWFCILFPKHKILVPIYKNYKSLLLRIIRKRKKERKKLGVQNKKVK